MPLVSCTHWALQAMLASVSRSVVMYLFIFIVLAKIGKRYGVGGLFDLLMKRGMFISLLVYWFVSLGPDNSLYPLPLSAPLYISY